MSKQIRSKNRKINKVCTNCFQPVFIKFNFSFITYEDNLTDREKAQLYDRIREISSVPYLIVSTWDKTKGFEMEKLNITKQIHPDFFDGNRTFDGKYTIFRLYKNNYPTPGRIIGKMINKIFYVFFIDVKGNLYKH